MCKIVHWNKFFSNLKFSWICRNEWKYRVNDSSIKKLISCESLLIWQKHCSNLLVWFSSRLVLITLSGDWIGLLHRYCSWKLGCYFTWLSNCESNGPIYDKQLDFERWAMAQYERCLYEYRVRKLYFTGTEQKLNCQNSFYGGGFVGLWTKVTKCPLLPMITLNSHWNKLQSIKTI